MSVIVTGMPRSGTSLMMRVLMKLGYEVIGDKYVEGAPIDENENGYWEPSYKFFKELKEPIKIGEKQAIKIWGGYLGLVDQESVDHIIYCYREDEEAAINSFMRGAAKQMPFRVDDKYIELTGSREEAENAINANRAYTLSWFDYYNRVNDNLMMISLETIKDKPLITVASIADMLGVDDDSAIINAYKIIEKEKRVS